MKRIEIGGVIPASAVSMGCMRLTDVKSSVDSVIGTALDCGIDFLTTPISMAAENARSFSAIIFPHTRISVIK